MCHLPVRRGIYGGLTEASLDTKFNSADLLFGQRIRIGDLLKLRLFAGLTAARIRVETDRYYDQTNLYGGTAYLDFNYDSKFEGIGPKAGLDVEYPLFSTALSIYASASGAGLVGESEAHSSEVQYLYFENPPTTEFDLGSEDESMLVPNVNVDLGLRYQYAFTQALAGAVLIGYRASEYFDAVRQVSEYDQGAAQVDDVTDFSLNGFYLQLSALF